MTFKSEDLLYALTRAAREVGLPAATSSTDFEAIARSQAIEMETRRLINVELMHERDRALADRDFALDLAAQYARFAGIEAPDLDAALRYAEQWREVLDRGAREVEELETRRLGNVDLWVELRDLSVGQRTFRGTVAELAKVVAERLSGINSAQHPPRKFRQPLAPPAVPQLPERKAS